MEYEILGLIEDAIEGLIVVALLAVLVATFISIRMRGKQETVKVPPNISAFPIPGWVTFAMIAAMMIGFCALVLGTVEALVLYNIF